jgi:hypothetical protein
LRGFVSSTGKTYGERAAEAAELAAQTRDPQLRQACMDLAEGWERLARQEVVLAPPPASTTKMDDDAQSSEPAPSE